MSYISFEDVKKIYQMGEVTIHAVDGVNFHIEKGEFAIIVGPSGAGKTTVLNMLGGMDASSGGTILVDGSKVSDYNAKQLTLYIEDFLSGLSSTNRYLFVRRYWYLDSARDLAKATGMAEGAVRTRLSRLRQQLKEALLEKEVLL